MSAWRAAGLTYVQYSTISARLLRKSLKQEFQKQAAKRGDSFINLIPWVNGKAAPPKSA